MIGGLRPYPRMRDSGVPWLGSMPEHWQLRRMKAALRERVQKGFPDEPLLAATQTKGVVAKEDYESRTVLALKDLHLLKLVLANDFVISLRSFQGGIEYARQRGIISPAYTILTARDADTHGFLAALFKSKPYLDNLSLYVTGIRQGQNIDYEKLSRSEFPFPPLAEQAAIVRFLDHMDRRIRRYIRAKQKLIALLEEQKQTIIECAVTRGRDAGVRLKPSGLEWLNDVPEHWEVRPAKWFFSEIDERSETGSEELLSVSHITGVTPRSEKNITMFLAASNVGHKLCRPGDMVVNTMWAWMAALGISSRSGMVSPSYAVYRPRPSSQLIGEYADLLLRTAPYKSEYLCKSTGIRLSRLRLYPDEFLRIKVLCPPPDEQREILDIVKSETAETRRAIGQAQSQIGLLREYRTRLVADVVTGKLDVREAATRLPGETAEPEPIADADMLGDGNRGDGEAALDGGAEEGADA